MSRRLLLWSVVSSLAGFLFGFDTVVISGAEQTIETLWGLSETEHGIAISSALWATVIGSMLGGIPTDRFGRKPTLIAIGVLYVASAILSAVSTGLWSLVIGRAIGGFGVGIATVAAPMYISEIAPAAHRGRLTALFQFNIVFGILVAFLSNAIIGRLLPDQTAWRWMLGIEALPAAIYAAAALVLPESPRYLIARRGDLDGGRAILAQINDDPAAVDESVAAIQTAAREADAATGSSSISLRAIRKPLLLAFLIAMFNQLSGINVVLYYAKRLFALAGLSERAVDLSSIGIGVVNLVATMAGLWLIDRAGRKSLLLLGSIGYIVSLGACAWAFESERFALVPWLIGLFIASHAVGQGAVIWVFISEIFPTRSRALGQSVGSSTHWVFAALLTFLVPRVLNEESSPAGPFAFFCGMMVLQLAWVLLMVPETKGVPLEEIEARLGIGRDRAADQVNG